MEVTVVSVDQVIEAVRSSPHIHKTRREVRSLEAALKKLKACTKGKVSRDTNLLNVLFQNVPSLVQACPLVSLFVAEVLEAHCEQFALRAQLATQEFLLLLPLLGQRFVTRSESQAREVRVKTNQYC